MDPDSSRPSSAHPSLVHILDTQGQPVYPNQQTSVEWLARYPQMPNYRYQSLQPNSEASPPLYQPPAGYAFGGGSTGAPYLTNFPESAGIEPFQGPFSYPETVASTKRRFSAVDETDETHAEGGERKEPQVRAKRPRRTLAGPQGGSNMSKKRQELEGKYGVGNITKDNKVRGSVVKCGDQLLWYDNKQHEYLPCVYHDDIREDLIRIANNMYPDYDVAPEKGLDPLDITSNCSALSQNTWSISTAEDRANIRDTHGVSVMLLSEKPKRPEPVLPPVWGHRGYVVLDQESHPILNWPQLPHTLSSKLEGWRIEALRRTIPGLEMSHLRARMPRNITPSKNKVKPVYGLSTIRHRASRFRDEHQIGAWDERQGTIEKKQRFSESQSTSRVSTPAIWSQSETTMSSPLLLTRPLTHPPIQRPVQPFPPAFTSSVTPDFTPDFTPSFTQPFTAESHPFPMTEQQFAEQLTRGLLNLDGEAYPSPPATFSDSGPPPSAPNDQIQGSVEDAPGEEADMEVTAHRLSQDAAFDLYSSNFHDMARELGDGINDFGGDLFNE